MSAGAATSDRGWSSAWLDAVAFAGGLALAWFGQWQTKDLVWSLWLSSLVVGYAMIVWMIFGPGVWIAFNAWRHREAGGPGEAGKALGLGAIYLVGGGFMLAFFTVHFGMFHLVHSMFLNAFFPVLPGANSGPSFALYAQVVVSYWPFVILAAVAERQAFRRPFSDPPAQPDTAVTPEAIAARKALQSGMGGMMTPYRNVIRLHLLIFFFAFARFGHLDNFAVYAVVYAVYFFPWRLLRRKAATVEAA